MKHTKGPWRPVDLDWDCNRSPAIVSSDHKIIARTENLGRITTTEGEHAVQASNAHLIAAAPEMLEALENVMGHYYDDCLCDNESVCNFCRIKADIEPIIKKAKGGAE